MRSVLGAFNDPDSREIIQSKSTRKVCVHIVPIDRKGRKLLLNLKDRYGAFASGAMLLFTMSAVPASVSLKTASDSLSLFLFTPSKSQLAPHYSSSIFVFVIHRPFYLSPIPLPILCLPTPNPFNGWHHTNFAHLYTRKTHAAAYRNKLHVQFDVRLYRSTCAEDIYICTYVYNTVQTKSWYYICR